jgi:hypothetical protein
MTPPDPPDRKMMFLDNVRPPHGSDYYRQFLGHFWVYFNHFITTHFGIDFGAFINVIFNTNFSIIFRPYFSINFNDFYPPVSTFKFFLVWDLCVLLWSSFSGGLSLGFELVLCLGVCCLNQDQSIGSFRLYVNGDIFMFELYCLVLSFWYSLFVSYLFVFWECTCLLLKSFAYVFWNCHLNLSRPNLST